MTCMLARIFRDAPRAALLGLVAVAGISDVPCALGQENTDVTVQVYDARNNKPLSLPEKMTISQPAARRCGIKISKYSFKAKASVNKYPMLFRADTKAASCKDRFPLLALYNIPTRGGVILEFRGELVPSGINDGKYEGLMIQQTGSAKRKPDFYLKVLELPVTDK